MSVDAHIFEYSMLYIFIFIYIRSLSREQLRDAQVNYILDEIVMAGMVLETNADLILEAIKDRLQVIDLWIEFGMLQMHQLFLFFF